MKSANSSDENPMVTVLLPTFNGEATLDKAIQSIVSQSYKNIELIIINDGSSDGSENVAKMYVSTNVKLIDRKVNLGLSSALNEGVDLAKGLFIARMDQDDVCHPKRIEKQVEFMQRNPDVDLLATSVVVFEPNSMKLLGSLPVKTTHDQICSSPLQGMYMPHPTWLGKTEWFRVNRYLSKTDGAEDQNLLFRSYKSSKFACLAEPLLAYREPRRVLRKMLGARLIFARSNSSIAWSDEKPLDAVKIIVWQAVKTMGDLLNILFRIPVMRNTLVKLDNVTVRYWEQILK